MATCQFCGRSFTNTQAVRAHLKACPDYQGRSHASGSALGRPPLGSRALGTTVPKAPDARPEPIDEEIDGQGQRETAPRPAQERAAWQAERGVEEFLRRAAAEQRARHRRELIQSAKDETVGSGSWRHPTIPAEVKAEALQEIERTLSKLPLHELPRHEVVQIAEGVRDRLFRPVLEAQEATRRRVQAEEQGARQRARAEEEALRQATVKEKAAPRAEEQAALERAEVKRRLLERGMSVADRELRADPELDPGERDDIRARVQSVLTAELSGEESKEEVEALVDDILDEEFDEDDDQDDDEDDEDDEDADDD
jgi:hypothetical protein